MYFPTPNQAVFVPKPNQTLSQHKPELNPKNCKVASYLWFSEIYTAYIHSGDWADNAGLNY